MTDSFKFDVNTPAFVPGGGSELKKASPQGSQEQLAPKGPKNNKRGGRKLQGQTNSSDMQRNRNRPPKGTGSDSNRRTPQQQQQQRHGDGGWDLEDYIEEADLVPLNRNKRGQVSLTHLLDFSHASSSGGGGGPRHGPGSYDFRRGSGVRRPRRDSNGNHSGLYAISSNHPPADKTTYINTTCRFVMDPRNSELYEPLLVDPDIPVPMEKVMRVLSRPSACPICLEDVPKAPRMLRCGHIMCFPCLLRYVDSVQAQVPVVPAVSPTIGTAFNAQQPKKPPPVECPLCFERIKVEHVKPVSFIVFDERFELPKEGQDIVVKLMFRPQGDANSIPMTDLAECPVSKGAFVQMPVIHGDGPDMADYSRLVQASHRYITKELEREIKDLEQQKQEELVLYQDESLTRFHREAISKIKRLVFETNEVFEAVQAQELAQELARASLRNNDQLLHVDQYDDNTAYFYYQTAFQSEIKYFLAPLDVKILRSEYGGSYHGLPSSLVVHVDNIVFSNYVNDELRKRLKYMDKLPAGTQVAFLECQWTADGGVVSAETLEKFAKEIGKRRKLKADKRHRENNLSRRIQRQEKSLLREDLLRESGVDIGPVNGGAASATTSMYDPFLEPALPSTDSTADTSGAPASGAGAPASGRKMTKTVWGTSVPEQDTRGILSVEEYYGSGSSAGLEYEPPSGNYAWADFSALTETVKVAESQEGSGSGNGGNGTRGRKNRKKLLLSSTSGGR